MNGIKLDQFVIMPPAVQENVKQIFAKGQQLGNNAQRFSKVGDSIIEQPHYMVKFDTPDYNLGQYAYLQDVLNYYRGSYGRDSLAVRRGLHSWSWNNPTWADKDQCQPDEGPVACEYRVLQAQRLVHRAGLQRCGRARIFPQEHGRSGAVHDRSGRDPYHRHQGRSA